MATYLSGTRNCAFCVFWCGQREINSFMKSSEADDTKYGKCSHPRTPYHDGTCAGQVCNEFEIHALLR